MDLLILNIETRLATASVYEDIRLTQKEARDVLVCLKALKKYLGEPNYHEMEEA